MRNQINNKDQGWSSFLMSIKILITLLVVFQFSNCKEDVEGCTDITATNWNAAADNPCESCCEYPRLIASLEHAYGDTTLFFGLPYLDDGGNEFFITRLRFYISKFELISNGSTYVVSDSITLILNDSTQNISELDDFVLVVNNIQNRDIGLFQSNENSFDSIRFLVGLDPIINQVDPELVTIGHPLSVQNPSMYWNELDGYIFQQIGITLDSVNSDTISYELGGLANQHLIALPFDEIVPFGQDFYIPLKIDYEEWFKGIDFVLNSDDLIKLKFKENLPNGFSVGQ